MHILEVVQGSVWCFKWTTSLSGGDRTGSVQGPVTAGIHTSSTVVADALVGLPVVSSHSFLITFTTKD